MAADGAFRIGVDLKCHRLSRPHAVELDLLEVRRHPDLVGDERGKARAGLLELADSGAEIDDAT